MINEKDYQVITSGIRKSFWVDDGIATGLTMRAAIEDIKRKCAKIITVAVPVAPPDIVTQLMKDIDKIIVLHSPESFEAV